MTRRSKEQLERDRADLLAVLGEAKGPLRTDVLICRAHGLGDPSWHERAWWPFYSRSYSDLRALARAGLVVCTNDVEAGYHSRWKLATPEDVDAEDDAREVTRMQGRWQEAVEPAPPSAVQQVEAMVAAGSMRRAASERSRAVSACRWPEKTKHESKAKAKAAIAAMYATGKGNPDLGVYQCGDHWHVGHELAHFKVRIRRALVGGRGRSTLYARNRRTKR